MAQRVLVILPPGPDPDDARAVAEGGLLPSVELDDRHSLAQSYEDWLADVQLPLFGALLDPAGEWHDAPRRSTSPLDPGDETGAWKRTCLGHMAAAPRASLFVLLEVEGPTHA